MAMTNQLFQVVLPKRESETNQTQLAGSWAVCENIVTAGDIISASTWALTVTTVSLVTICHHWRDLD